MSRDVTRERLDPQLRSVRRRPPIDRTATNFQLQMLSARTDALRTALENFSTLLLCYLTTQRHYNPKTCSIHLSPPALGLAPSRGVRTRRHSAPGG